MPDKPLTVFTYAASASLAAVALVYFFHPTYLLDNPSSTASANSRKKGIIGLVNPANDCFINCNLQSLAGLGDLRVYLIREVHRRDLGGDEVYGLLPDERDAEEGEKKKKPDPRKLLSLQAGEVTRGLKAMIDRLNERPIARKTISAAPFIRVLESAFGTTISKAQQDAQELLQIVTERLSEEYHAGQEARKRFKRRARTLVQGMESEDRLEKENSDSDLRREPSQTALSEAEKVLTGRSEQGRMMDDEDGFPLEGKTEARVECSFCHFVPKVTPTSFVMLNLMVPQQSHSSLNDCFDAHFKTEHIDDYKCDKCRLVHALEIFTKEMAITKSSERRQELDVSVEKLKAALNEDPEKPLQDVALPDIKSAPKRRIARYIEIVTFPKLLIIHLSRSIFDPRSSSTKNLAKVSFPERLPVGGLLKRRHYKLLGVVCHKGTHNSGHYETFRRQHSYAPYSNPHSDKATGPYSSGKELSESTSTPGDRPHSDVPDDSPKPSFTTLKESTPSTSPRTSGTSSIPSTQPSSKPEQKPQDSKTADPIAKDEAILNDKIPPSKIDLTRMKRRKKPADRWWRISDDKIKECKTNDVLGMTREVYMLFYEMERSDNAAL